MAGLRAVLADLGESKQQMLASRTAVAGTVGVGTPLYMAPESREAEEFKGPKVCGRPGAP